MKKNIVVPEMGESVSTGVIVDWLKKNGDAVREGDPLFELETDKATVVVPATSGGTIEILAEKDAEVRIGQVVALVDDAAAAMPLSQPAAEKSPVAQPPVPLSPSVRRIVEENRLEPSALPGSGAGGRITKADAQAAAEKQQPQAVAPAAAKTGQTRVKMTLLRKKTAERLVQARLESVHVTTYNEVDMGKVMGIRSHFQEAFEKEHGVKIGYMSFFVKACCKALSSHRELNAQVEGDEIVYNDFCNIGIAISMDRGLIVPVVRNAERLTFAELERAIADLARRGRDKRLLPDELSGGTFSITNGGVFGSLMSTPVPAYPQSAILGMHTIKKRPVAVGDEVVVRPMMYVALTYDHRIVDGKDAIGFLVKVKEFVEDPDTLLLEM
ncbi:MAG TPA: 2-oxoglutarate dehydrogenase complex dihydrolipoyllysine-residue succinyltransferase [Chitinivibrionales bacterium]|nr:2-oxoglutarate dehydrogenase complex dihydrolipoyllysine-residue succinyltransferase [Chitinivibrionales bacterium]